MKVVITGGTGFLGRALAASLASHEHDVVVLSRFSGGTYMNVRHVRAQVQHGRFDAAGTAEIGAAQAVINLAGAGNGAQEVRNWLVAHGAAHSAGFELVDYLPVPEVYVGCGFAAWKIAQS